MRRRLTRALGWIAGAAVLGAFAWANLRSTVALSGPLPEFQATAVDGRKLSRADLLGKVSLINFWSPG